MCGDWKTVEYIKEKKRRGYYSVDAVDPHDGKLWELLISEKKAKWTAAQGEGRTKELCHTVRGVLSSPSAIYRGVRFAELDVDDDSWFCYVGRPRQAYDHKTGKAVPAWENEVFLVFVNEDRVVYNWSWYTSDTDNPALPLGHEARFAEKVI